MEGAGGGSRRGTRMRSVWVRYDSGEAVVGETRMEIVINKNICLRGIVSDSWWRRLMARTGLRSLCIIFAEWRYFNPFAASASFSHVLGLGGSGEIGDHTYQTKAVDLRAS